MTNDELKDADLKAARELCDAATPGPWATERLDAGYVSERVEVLGPIEHACGEGMVKQSVAATCSYTADAAFIAAARTLVPQLLDEVDRLQGIERECDRWRHGVTIEGDHVCPSDLERDALRAALTEALYIAERWYRHNDRPVGCIDNIRIAELRKRWLP